MSTHAAFVTAAYAAAGIGIAGLIAWVSLDGRARQAEMRELERSGARRRSDAASAGDGSLPR